jgi:hypothetical protein
MQECGKVLFRLNNPVYFRVRAFTFVEHENGCTKTNTENSETEIILLIEVRNNVKHGFIKWLVSSLKTLKSLVVNWYCAIVIPTNGCQRTDFIYGWFQSNWNYFNSIVSLSLWNGWILFPSGKLIQIIFVDFWSIVRQLCTKPKKRVYLIADETCFHGWLP